jgi:hypothetical protein
MRMDLMTLSLLMVAGTPALAMAQGCTEAEAVLRADAAQLGPMLTQLGVFSNEYQMKQKLITDEYDYFYYYYGTAPDVSPGTYIGNLESEKVVIQQNYDALLATAQPLDAKVTTLVASYEAACGANAKTTDLLNQYGIVILPKQQGQ